MTYIASTDFFFEAAGGRASGFDSGIKFGRNPTTAAAEDVWEAGGDYTGQPDHADAAETVEVFSSDANDTSAGTGARTVRIEGLDGSWNEIGETITLNGVSAVTSSLSYKRVFRQYVTSAGSGGENAGTITVRHTTTTANVFSVMNIGNNQTEIACYTVPAGKTCYIRGINFAIVRSAGAAASAIWSLRTREENKVYRAREISGISTNYPISKRYESGIVCPAKTDIKVRVESVSTTVDTFAEFEFFLVDD